jgi:hypothetical protein
MNLKSAQDTTSPVFVRALQESDLPVAVHVMRLAFGTFLGLSDPASFAGDASYVGHAGERIQTPPSPPKSMRKSSAPISLRTGAASDFSVH